MNNKEPTFTQTNADLYIPDGSLSPEALKKTTHLGVGAHQDDLEFMAMHGIIECYEKQDLWFGGITCTNGAGSARTGPYAEITDEQMLELRFEEQREASRVGKYAFMAQLRHPSSGIKDPHCHDLERDLAQLLERTRPEVVYTHNLADKHSTHIAVAMSLIKAIRSLPEDQRPGKLIGCEVWRDLDWMPDNKKVVMDLSGYQELAARLNGIFVSQISGGKRYDLAVDGRRRANATFFDSHSIDDSDSICYGIDLTPLVLDEQLSPAAYTLELVEEFRNDVENKILSNM